MIGFLPPTDEDDLPVTGGRQTSNPGTSKPGASNSATSNPATPGSPAPGFPVMHSEASNRQPSEFSHTPFPEVTSLSESSFPRDSLLTTAKSYLVWIIGFALVLLVAVVWWLGQQSLPSPTPSPQTTPSPSASYTYAPIVPASVDFVTDTTAASSTTGTFSLISTQWTDTTLQATVEVSVTSGRLTYGFFAIDNESSTQILPTEDPHGVMKEGQHRRFTLTFQQRPQETTIVLMNDGTQLTALSIVP